MGISKNSLAAADDALEILKKIGGVACCDAHEEYYYETGALNREDIKEKAVEVFNESYSGYYDVDTFLNAIDQTLNEAGLSESDCPFCAKAFAE